MAFGKKPVNGVAAAHRDQESFRKIMNILGVHSWGFS
jgi:hypothetical protein